MNKLLVSGVYDAHTLKTLMDLGTKAVAFDLRGRSPNLIPFSQLKTILTKSQNFEASLLFENDRPSTIFSFLNLLKEVSTPLVLQFRDQQNAAYYQQFDLPFTWMFHPDAAWREILPLNKLKGLLLPIKFQSFYQNSAEFWDLINYYQIEVYLHAESIEESELTLGAEGINLSFDLTGELENGFRSIDQDRLKKLKVWSFVHEDLAS